MFRRPMLDEQVGQHVDHVVGPEPSQRHHRQTFAAELVDDIEHPELASVARLILDEVVRPHMPAMLWPQPYTRPIAQPEPTSFRLPLRHFKTLPPPDAFHYRQADLPACMAEQGMDAAIAVPAIIPGQLSQGRPITRICRIGSSKTNRLFGSLELDGASPALSRMSAFLVAV